MSNADLNSLPLLLEKKATEAKLKLRDVTVALEEAQRTEKVWQCLLEAQKYDHSAAILSIFRKKSDVFEQLRKQKDESIPLLELFYRESKKNVVETVRSFTKRFPEACDAAGIVLDQGSRHPKYSIRGFIQTLVDERRFEVQITPRDSKSVTLPLDMDPLVAHLQTEVRRLFETKRDPEKFLAGLRKAYQAVLREEKKSPGDELPLRRVANRLSKNRTHFRYDEFNVGLGNLVCSGKTSIDNVRLHLNHTRDTRQGMLLHGLERSGYLGFISFKPEES